MLRWQQEGCVGWRRGPGSSQGLLDPVHAWPATFVPLPLSVRTESIGAEHLRESRT